MFENYREKVHLAIMKLGRFNIFKIYGIFALIWITEQLISRGIEILIWGNSFPHFIDIAFLLILTFEFTYIAWRLIEILDDAVIELRKSNELHS